MTVLLQGRFRACTPRPASSGRIFAGRTKWDRAGASARDTTGRS